MQVGRNVRFHQNIAIQFRASFRHEPEPTPSSGASPRALRNCVEKTKNRYLRCGDVAANVPSKKTLATTICTDRDSSSQKRCPILDIPLGRGETSQQHIWTY